MDMETRSPAQLKPSKKLLLLRKQPRLPWVLSLLSCTTSTPLEPAETSLNSRRGYYDNVKFHRIIKDFIVQGGDPTGTGREEIPFMVPNLKMR
ncbi:hypothetical protein K1719_041617 [Acacia pycnantha]|nr:hypothetical protein K1719_041617 [Acacia pycnantha]